MYCFCRAKTLLKRTAVFKTSFRLNITCDAIKLVPSKFAAMFGVDDVELEAMRPCDLLYWLWKKMLRWNIIDKICETKNISWKLPRYIRIIRSIYSMLIHWMWRWNVHRIRITVRWSLICRRCRLWWIVIILILFVGRISWLRIMMIVGRRSRTIWIML